MTKIPRPSMRRVQKLALLVQPVSLRNIEKVWTQAHKFQTWDVGLYSASAPSRAVVFRVKRVLQLSGVLK